MLRNHFKNVTQRRQSGKFQHLCELLILLQNTIRLSARFSLECCAESFEACGGVTRGLGTAVSLKPVFVFARRLCITHASSERDSDGSQSYTGCSVCSARDAHNLSSGVRCTLLCACAPGRWAAAAAAAGARCAVPAHDRTLIAIPRATRDRDKRRLRHRGSRRDAPPLSRVCIRDSRSAPPIMLRKYPRSYTKLYYSPRACRPRHDHSTILIAQATLRAFTRSSRMTY